MGPLMLGFFSVVNTTALHDLAWLLESRDTGPGIQMNLRYRGTLDTDEPQI